MTNYRPYRDIQRRKSRQIMVGDVPVGGDAPISVQTMTNTSTADVVATLKQIRRAADAGADLVRVSCPDEDSTAALKTITKKARFLLSQIFIFITAARLKPPKQGPRVLELIPVILDPLIGYPKWYAPRVIMAVLCA